MAPVKKLTEGTVRQTLFVAAVKVCGFALIGCFSFEILLKMFSISSLDISFIFLGSLDEF
jgi:hypothetical protein